MRRTFEDWMAEVDRWLEDKCGLSSLDLPDACYRDAYDDGESAARFAREVYREAGGP